VCTCKGQRYHDCREEPLNSFDRGTDNIISNRRETDWGNDEAEAKDRLVEVRHCRAAGTA